VCPEVAIVTQASETYKAHCTDMYIALCKYGTTAVPVPAFICPQRLHLYFGTQSGLHSRCSQCLHTGLYGCGIDGDAPTPKHTKPAPGTNTVQATAGVGAIGTASGCAAEVTSGRSAVLLLLIWPLLLVPLPLPLLLLVLLLLLLLVA
jgi:hypothetical protein